MRSLDGIDAVVCLSRVTVGKRWTESYKQQIEQSRVDSVATLARSLNEHGGPRTLVCASAVGYYGDTGATTAFRCEAIQASRKAARACSTAGFCSTEVPSTKAFDDADCCVACASAARASSTLSREWRTSSGAMA